MKTIALVPARSGSKGIKHKNIRFVSGKSLLQHAANCAAESELISEAYICSDSQLYQGLGERYGLKSLGLRTKRLAADNTRTIDVLKNFIDCFPSINDVGFIVLLQPTSPLRDGKLVDKCIKLAQETGQSVVTVSPINEPHPHKTLILKDGKIKPATNTQ